jgi:hypothetical protein
MAVIVKTGQTMKPKLILCLALVLSGALPAVVQAKFIYSTNADGGTVTITGYSDSGGEVVIPGMINGLQVTSIGNFAFARHPTITGITISDSVTSIGDEAFTAVDTGSSLTKVTIGNSVTSIGRGAFTFCEKLTSVEIPKSVVSIGNGVFGGCFGLKRIMVDANNTAYISVDGVLFNKSKTALIQFPAGKAGNCTIPDTVTNIADMALWNCLKLTSVTIPNGITSIGQEAFAACNSLTNVTIPASVTSIGIWAFDSCVSLKGIYFHGNAPRLGRYHAFNGADNAIIYYLPGTTGWGKTFDGRPTALWNP